MNKTIKTILFIGILVFILGALLIYAQPNERNSADVSTSQTGTALSVDKLIHDFGTISMKNGNVKTTFKIKNTGDSEITLNKMYTSCMCTQAILKINGVSEGPFGMPGHEFLKTFNHKLQPNEEAEIEVEFDPNAHGPSGVGRIDRTITVEESSRKSLTVTIRANVTP